MTVHSATILKERVVGLKSLGSLAGADMNASLYVACSSLNACRGGCGGVGGGGAGRGGGGMSVVVCRCVGVGRGGASLRLWLCGSGTWAQPLSTAPPQITRQQ